MLANSSGSFLNALLPYLRLGHQRAWNSAPCGSAPLLGQHLRRHCASISTSPTRWGAGGSIIEVQWGGPLFQAGVGTGGATILAVGDRTYSEDALKAAIAAARTGREPIRLLVKEGTRVRDVSLEYHGGLRWPWLEKTAKIEALLDRMLTPL